MSSGRKCKNCGSSDIEVDPARGDAVCTSCGSVLEDNIIVAEIQFEEGAHGGAIGQFVSADSKGGATKFGASFHVGASVESREQTLKKARNGISILCNQLQLNQHCIDTACGFFKMALSRNLTRGRRNTHVHAACVYLTCRTEGTAHLLIDISDVLQICCYELGRTYLRLSQALCINIPAVDPCLYILRFAAKLDFGPKTQMVANTALRLVQRMKRDSIHSGRRPSGLCGAALLMAARLHEFGRTSMDIVKIVKVHESTIRKRLIEFGDTPSSALTLDEFMTVDLEEEQDPPSFKAARKRDKERLQKLMEEEADSFSELQKQIETQLEDGRKKFASRYSYRSSEHENQETDRFIHESTMGAIEKIMNENTSEAADDPPVKGLGPDIESMGLANSLDDTTNAATAAPALEMDLTLTDLDDAELDTYIMSEHEYQRKQGLWHKRNAPYLEAQKLKAERLQKEREEGKPEKKRKRTARKKAMGPANSAGEAIEKIIQEKKISSKINYDVLKSLNATIRNEAGAEEEEDGDEEEDEEVAATTSEKRPRVEGGRKRKAKDVGMPVVEAAVAKVEPEVVKEVPAAAATMSEEELDEDFEEEEGEPEPSGEMGVLEMLQKHREDEGGDDDEYGYGGYDDDY